MTHRLSILAIACCAFAAQTVWAAEPPQNQTYAALSGAASDVEADLVCENGSCFAQRAALDGMDMNLGGMASVHGSVTYRVQIRHDSTGTHQDNLMSYDLSFCQQLTPGVSLLVEIGTGGSFNHPLDAFNDFYHPEQAAQKARLKQAYLHIN